MKKTVQVNLSGQVFTLDEDAYDLLSNYLQQIGTLYERSAGKDEIISDIELRIAELLLERMDDSKSVVTVKDVEAVIEIMGRPEQFEEDEDSYASSSSSRTENFRSKRLYRDQDGAIIGGVCSGIGHYFGIDPIWLRLIMAISFIVFGTGILLYIILWIIIPSAKTTAEKLSMKGEPVNINSIGRTIEEEINSFGERISNSDTTKKYTRKAANGVDRFFHFIAELFRRLFSIIGKVFGTAFFVVGLLCTVGILAGIFGIADFFHWGNGDWSSSMSIYEFGDVVFSSGEWFVAAVSGLLLTIGIPFIALAYGGFVLLFPHYKVPYLGVSLLGTWFIGIVIVVFTALGVAHDFSKEEIVKHEIVADSLINASDTIYLELGKDPFNIEMKRAYYSRNDFMMKTQGDEILIGNLSFDIDESNSDETYFEVYKSAQSESFESARGKAESIKYSLNLEGNKAVLDGFFSFPKKDLLRDQEVRVVLHIPEGKTVYLSENMKRLIDDIDNIQDMWDPYMIDHFWQMTPRGLNCSDCEKEDIEDKDVDTVISGEIRIESI